MTFPFQEEIEKMAEEYVRDEGWIDDSYAAHEETYKAGAAALENLIMKSVDEFPLAKRCNESIEQMKLGVAIDSAYLRGARTQHGEDQLIIGVLREEIEVAVLCEKHTQMTSERIIDDYAERCKQLKIGLDNATDKIQQLEQKIKELEK